MLSIFFFQAEDGIRCLVRSRGLGDVYKRQSVGSAMVGMRPVAEIMFADFLGECYDQLVNNAAKLSLIHI